MRKKKSACLGECVCSSQFVTLSINGLALRLNFCFKLSMPVNVVVHLEDLYSNVPFLSFLGFGNTN